MDFLSVLSYLLIYIILPLAGIAALITLAMVFNNSAKSIKVLTDDVEYKLKVLNKPIEAIVNINETIGGLVNFFKSLKKTIEDLPEQFKDNDE